MNRLAMPTQGSPAPHGGQTANAARLAQSSATQKFQQAVAAEGPDLSLDELASTVHPLRRLFAIRTNSIDRHILMSIHSLGGLDDVGSAPNHAAALLQSVWNGLRYPTKPALAAAPRAISKIEDAALD